MSADVAYEITKTIATHVKDLASYDKRRCFSGEPDGCTGR